MNFFPYEKLILPTSHSVDEIKRRLEAGIGKPRGGGLKALKKAEKLFEGNIEGNKFFFWRAIRHSNGFMPIVTAIIEPGRLEVELKLHPFIRIFFPVWMGVLLLLGFGALQNPNTSRSPGVMTPFFVVIFVYLMMVFFYNFYAEKAKAFLKEVVK